MTRKLMAFVASLALVTPVLGAQQAKGPANKPAAQTAAKSSGMAKADSAKPDSAKGATKSTSKKGSAKKGSGKSVAKDTTKGGSKKP